MIDSSESAGKATRVARIGGKTDAIGLIVKAEVQAF